MSLKKDIRNYFEARVEAQRVPECPALPVEAPPLDREERNGGRLVLSLAFHAALIAFFSIILAANAGTGRSLRKIDPDGRKGLYWQHKVGEGLAEVRAYFRPIASRNIQGGQP